LESGSVWCIIKGNYDILFANGRVLVMSRLPIPGQDPGVWGYILNDYLAIAHNADGSLRASSVTASSLAAGAVNATALADGSVDGAKLADGAVTIPKLGITNTPSTGQLLAFNGSNLSWVTGSGSGAVADASSTAKGVVQLAGDLGGTADVPTVPGLATKESTIAAGTTSQYFRGDKTWQTLDKATVGLSDADNTSDAAKNSAVAAITNKTIDGTANTLSNIPQSAVTNLTTSFNAKADTTRNIAAGTGLIGGGDLSADRTLSVADDTTTQRVRVSRSGTLAGVRQEVNLVEGSNVTITATDDVVNNRVNVTIAAAATISIDNLPAGTTLTVLKSGGVWPDRPTARSDIIVQWKGPDPSPPIISSGTGGMLDNVDIRLVTP
jgi:hypothetical protein